MNVILRVHAISIAWAYLGLVAIAQEQEWVGRYNGPGLTDTFAAMAVDTVGNVYMVGSTGSGSEANYSAVKFNAAGSQIWSANYNGSANGPDSARCIALGDAGSVYVSGESFADGTGKDFATVKYDFFGNEEWVARFNGPANMDDGATSMAVDSGGDVYVTGYAVGSNGLKDFATVKYDSTGRQLWATYYDGPAQTIDNVAAIAVDQFGNCYVTGTSRGTGSGDDYATIKYDAVGSQVWVSRYNGQNNGYDVAVGLTISPQGEVYVTGYSDGGISTRSDYTTIKYDSNGNQLWVQKYNGPANGDDYAAAIAIDSGGNVSVTGYSASGASSDDFATVKYEPGGGQLWAVRFNGLANKTDRAAALAVDPLGNVFVTGYSLDDTGTGDYAAVKYDSAGNKQWASLYDGGTGYFGGGGFGDRSSAIAVVGSGKVYVAGTSDGLNGFDFAVVKYADLIETIPPESFSVDRGQLVSGSLADLWSSDNHRMEIQQRPPLLLADPQVRLQVEATAIPDPVTSFTFRVEGFTTTVPALGATYKIELYNFVNQVWESFTVPASNSETVNDIVIDTNPERFIEPGTRKLRSRMSIRSYGVALAWSMKIDQAIWILSR